MPILSAAQVAHIMNNPAELYKQVLTDEEREWYRDNGEVPLIDTLIAAYVKGAGIDTSAEDVHRAAKLTVLHAERDYHLRGMDDYLDGLE